MATSSAEDHKSQKKPTASFKRKLFLALLVLLALVLLASVMYRWPNNILVFVEGNDFTTYWQAGQVLLRGDSPAGFANQDEPMWSPPWILILFLPLFFFPFPVAAFLWLFISLALFFICSAVLWRIFTSGETHRSIGVAWVATLIFMPMLFDLRIGQSSVWILLGMVGFLFFATKGKEELAGLSLALTTIKPHIVYLPLIAAGWWILQERRWRVLLGLLGTMVVWIGILLLLSPYSLAHYWQLYSQTPPVYCPSATLGSGLQALFGFEHVWLQFLPMLLAASAVGIFLLLRRPTIRWQQALSPLLLLSVPTSAFGLSYDHVVLLVPYLQVLAWFIEQKEKKITSYLVPGALILINGLALWQNQLGKVDNMYFLWVPLALGLVYLYAWWTLKRSASAKVQGKSSP